MMKNWWMIILVGGLGAGCGQQEIADAGQPKKLIVNPIIEKAIKKQLVQPPDELTEADLERLTWFNLAQTQITDAGLKEVAKLQQLTSLDLRLCGQITDTGLKEVAKLQKLTSLDLSWCKQITDTGLKEVAKLQRLTSLDLEMTNITDVGLKEVAKLRQLTSLGLDRTRITGAGLKELAKV